MNFFVMVNAAAPGGLQPVKNGQSEGRGEADDSPGGPAKHDQSPNRFAL